MSGTYQYDVEIKSNVEKLLKDMKEAQDKIDDLEKKEYTVKLNIDEEKLSNVISNLEKMLNSLSNGTGDFKQFENLSKELSSIVSEVQSLSKAFGKLDDSGGKSLLSSIQNIDKSLSDLSQNILNVNKNMSNMGGNTNGVAKQVENITNESKKATSALEDVAKAQEKTNGQETNISSGMKDAFPSQTFDNEMQQNLVMLENYKNTVKEIDKLKLEPDTEETKHKIEELNKLADYFVSQITVIRGENGHDVSPSMMKFSGLWNEQLKKYPSDKAKELYQLASDKSGLQINSVVKEFSGIESEITNI